MISIYGKSRWVKSTSPATFGTGRSLFSLHSGMLTMGCSILEGVEMWTVLRAAQAISEQNGIHHSTVQIDPYDSPECLLTAHE